VAITTAITITITMIMITYSQVGDVPGMSEGGTLTNVKFYAENEGESILDLYDTILINSQELFIIHSANDGTVTITNPVGGIWITPNKLELLAPYIELASAISIAAVVTAILVKRKKKQEEAITERKGERVRVN